MSQRIKAKLYISFIRLLLCKNCCNNKALFRCAVIQSKKKKSLFIYLLKTQYINDLFPDNLANLYLRQ